MKKYPETSSNQNLAELENNIQDFWRKNKIFEKSLEKNKGKEDYVFYDGPPFANGLPHYGHLLTGFVKDIVARYQTMKGKFVARRFGWDTHGLPVEMETEKELGVSGRTAINEFGIEKFNDACRESVMKYSGDWEEYVTKQARWVDFENDYKTMDVNYMESVIWAFKELHNKGLLYQEMRVMPYSWKCQTPLSNFETRLDNSYREKESKALTISFILKGDFKNVQNAKMLIWTTTPWTLPSNLAAAVGNEINYVMLKKGAEHYIIAKNLISRYKKELGEDHEIIAEFLGEELVGRSYEPVFSYFIDNPGEADLSQAYKIYAADFVTTDDGTGIVHMAPGFGEDDQLICKEKGIPTLCPVDDAGCFTFPISDFVGRQVFDCNIDIIKNLKERGLWLKTEQYLHNYPHCWRTDTPLIYKAIPSWYVAVSTFKERMVELNQDINWTPSHIKDGLFGKWLANARDWSISRNRFWGCPVPVWTSTDPEYPRIDVYGSRADLEKDFGVKVDNLHRPFIDELTRKNPDDPTGKSMMVRVSDVLDCWFESGSMPYAQVHYPFENKKEFEEKPADFIVEYKAQTRGWFYTLMVLSTALFDRAPFKNCICHGVILDENSQKLSKRLKNYTSPLEIFKKYGSDAMRFFLCSMPVMWGNELNIDKEGECFKETLRTSIKPIWNAYNFFTLYANADEIEAKFSLESKNLMDQYIIDKMKTSIAIIDSGLKNYDLPKSYKAIDSFFEILNNWYIRRNRERFWKKEKDQDKIDAYNTLYSVLREIIKSLAPLIPNLAEAIFQGLEKDAEISVHLEDFPNGYLVNDLLDVKDAQAMDRVRDICNIALSLRAKQNVRVRQPLAKITILGQGSANLEQNIEYKKLICDEVNVKKVEFLEEIGDLADYKLDLNFKLIGQNYPKLMKQLIPLAKQGKWEKVAEGIKILDIVLNGAEANLSLKPTDENSMKSLSSNDGLVVLDFNLTKTLTEEGVARDLVRLIQQKRKDLDFDITDKIKISIFVQDNKEAIAAFSSYIKEQTLGEEIIFADNLQGEEFSLLEEKISLTIERI